MGARVHRRSRRVAPRVAADLATLPAERIATVVGRYYAMDRDKRWERTDRAVAAIVDGVGERADDPVAAVRASYERGITDEFVEPVVLAGRPRLDPARDCAIVFNFRPDRVRQLTERLLERGVDLVTMTRYRDDLDCPVAFAGAGRRHARRDARRAGRRQLHVAETEKYAHVTYFFNGGVEEPWPGEDRILVPSPRDVPSYDLKPEMSAAEVGARVAAALARGLPLLRGQLREPRHGRSHGRDPGRRSGGRDGRRVPRRGRRRDARAGGVCLVTADHGNAEKLLEDDGVSPHTAHTTNPVPLILTLEGGASETGASSPTWRRPCSSCSVSDAPAAMTGRSLVVNNR